MAKASTRTTYRAKIFRTGGSQAVRLPKECRLPGEEVIVRRAGALVVLAPIQESYDHAFREMVLGDEDPVISRPPQRRVDRRERLR